MRFNRSSTQNSTVGLLGCGFYAIGFAMTFAFAGFLFEYSMWSIFGRDVPWYADVIGGLVCNAVTLPVAVCCWIARLAGVDVPFFHG